MGQTESIVVQVAPAYENRRIKEMEMFAWNLHGRQEIHQRGNALGMPSYMSDSTYLVKTSVSRYVKLHFVRSMTHPHREQLKPLEREYFSFEAPSAAPLVPGGIPFGCLALVFWWPLWPLWYFRGYKPRLAAARTRLTEITKRQKEIIAEVVAIRKPKSSEAEQGGGAEESDPGTTPNPAPASDA